MIKRGLSLLLVLFFSSAAIAQQAPSVQSNPPPGEALNRRADQLFAKWGNPESPGCALAVIKDGRIIYKQSYGAASLEYGVPISSTTVFDTASLSKQFTAMAILMLAEQRKLSLSDDIRKYLPEVPEYGSPVTIRHLLNHTSGLRVHDELLNLTEWRFGNVITNQDVLTLTSRQKALNFKPGEDFEYNNTGYVLLAIIVNRVSGQPIREFADVNIFKPLGMTNTFFRDNHNLVVKGLALAYQPRRIGGFRLNTPVEETVGNGGVFSTIEDLALWDQNYYDKKVGGDIVIRQMLDPGPEVYNGGRFNYGYGLFIGGYGGLRIVEHGGDHYGYHSHLLRFPDQRFSVACLCNAGDADPWTLSRQVAKIYLEDRLSPAPKTTAAVPGAETSAISLTEKELEGFAGIYLDSATDSLRRLFVKDHKLMFFRAGGSHNELRPLGDGRFLMLGIGTKVELTFSPRGHGPGRQMTMITERRKPVVHELVEPFTPDAGQLAEYAGTYYCEELDTAYHVVLEGGKLILRVKNSDDNQLLPQFSDAFTDASMSLIIRFTRNRQNRVSGLALSFAHVRKLGATKI